MCNKQGSVPSVRPIPCTVVDANTHIHTEGSVLLPTDNRKQEELIDTLVGNTSRLLEAVLFKNHKDRWGDGTVSANFSLSAPSLAYVCHVEGPFCPNDKRLNVIRKWNEAIHSCDEVLATAHAINRAALSTRPEADVNLLTLDLNMNAYLFSEEYGLKHGERCVAQMTGLICERIYAQTQRIVLDWIGRVDQELCRAALLADSIILMQTQSERANVRRPRPPTHDFIGQSPSGVTYPYRCAAYHQHYDAACLQHSSK